MRTVSQTESNRACEETNRLLCVYFRIGYVQVLEIIKLHSLNRLFAKALGYLRNQNNIEWCVCSILDIRSPTEACGRMFESQLASHQLLYLTKANSHV